MQQSDLTRAYRIAVDRLIKQKQTLGDDVFWNMFNQNDAIGVNRDYGQMLCFARCYELTMAYLTAKQDIKDNFSKGASHDDRQILMEQAKRLKAAGARMFNNMQNCDLYFNQREMQHYRDFFNAFYNDQPCDMRILAQSLKENLNDARDIFEKRDNAKIGGDELGDACFKFSNTNAFVKMARLALSVENKNIHELGDYIANIERLSQDISEKHAMESKITNRGFVTHNAFALSDDKKVRDRDSKGVERFVLSTPGIKNKVGQEYLHLYLLNNRFCTVPQQRVYGERRWVENTLDFIRGFTEAVHGAEKLTGGVSKIYAFFTRDTNDIRVQKDMKKFGETLDKKLKHRMPQEILGRYKNSEPKDLILRTLILDAKAAHKTITEKEAKERDLLHRAADILTETAQDTIMDIAQNDFELNEAIKGMAKEIEKYGVEVFDKFRYDDLKGLTPCDGEYDTATLRLITHMMNYGEQELINDPQTYYDAMNLLDDIFKEDIDTEIEIEEMLQDHQRE